MRNQGCLEETFLLTLRRFRNNQLNGIYPSLSAAEFYTLFAILRLREEGAPSVRMSAVVEELRLSSQAVSKMLRTLERKGYCQRIADPRDRRTTLIFVTENGEVLAKEAKDRIFHFARQVTERMGRENMESFVTLACQCADAMQDISREQFAKKEELS
ncbi:MAG: MarR family transcriptional regulator [Oscillospiraceae bacterium]|nr:MarR family transcriptional regulator [Oscillospiraceae bacterium]